MNMNMQAMLRQAQNLQKEMLKSQEEINNTTFTAENGLVKVTMKGNRKLEKVEISREESFSSDDLEMLEDMVLVAVNDALSQIDKTTEEKMGKYTKGIPGLF
jgi:DNA-binding YbaB/EbfC family protein